MQNVLILNPSFILRDSFSLKRKLTLKILWILLFISIIFLLALYIFQVNSLTGENYLLKKQERNLAEIKREKEILEINFSRANSLANIENYFQNQNFKKANQVKYIQILETSIVAGR
jgi:uncharacterized protein YxeA